ncbi:HAD family hydrolase [Candidatus Entotheonella serta]|nr:HAD family hydrolase [Candidatus Entotheonella serta]
MVSAVVFDFDYTLADSSVGILKCIQYALEQMDLSPAPANRMRESIGLTLPKTLTFLTGYEDAEAGAEFTQLFVEHADRIMADHTVLYHTAPQVITTLHAAGLPLGIVSTKYRYRIEGILQRESLLEHFKIIVGGEDVTEHKPHPLSLQQALQHLDCAPEDAVYIGDHTVDAEAAGRAGIPFVAVLTGTSGRHHFDADQCLGILNDLSALPPLLGH